MSFTKGENVLWVDANNNLRRGTVHIYTVDDNDCVLITIKDKDGHCASPHVSRVAHMPTDATLFPLPRKALQSSQSAPENSEKP